MTMTAKTLYVRHVQSGEIKKVTEDQRANQDKNFWVRITGDVKETAPADVPTGVDAEPENKTASTKK
ncbi:hypothetical protein HUN59_05155 [Curtobacterium sp. Csp2]|uniref:hypothetical protein n=1 Tax=Curtobacterium sp. Csp2 TaxID=2495430 RepID=UPI0015804442|nr:hypothetical protein [Curtobacterium sp. Csp2]QKS15685.1 hypothetical protein HUN59_05155 [Curtobacterium sp. Csp2]